MGSSSSLPTRGQNGGNVTFIKDPSVGAFSIIVNNRGGRGGRGSNGGRSAANGADGRFITRTQAVSLSW